MAAVETRRRWIPVKGVRRAYSRRPATNGRHHWTAVKARPASRPFEPEPDDEPRDVPQVEIVDVVAPTQPATRELHERSRAIRISRVTSNGRRRWAVDFLVRRQA